MQYWLERIAFSCIIIACCLGWEAYKIHTGRAPGTETRIAVYITLAAILMGTGLAGIRQRHRTRR